MPASGPMPSGPDSRPSLAGKTVVIADDDPIIVDYLELRCRHLGLKVETATDGLRAVLKVGKARPDLLILDLNLPDVEGFKVVERLSDPKFSPVPIIILTGSSDEAAKQRCADLDVYYVHKGVDSWPTLEPLIYELLLRPPEEPETPSPETAVPNVLLVDDDPVVLQGLTQRLQKYGLNVWQASGGTEGYLMVLRSKPDIVVTDYNMDKGSGHYLLSRIKGSPSTQHIPVIVYTAAVMTKGEEAAIQRDIRGRGQAAAFLPKSANSDDLVSELRRHIPFPASR
jgi:CheY-like chemotaxis protein